MPILLLPLFLWAQNEIGPEGSKLIYVLGGVVLISLVFLIGKKLAGKNKKTKAKQTPFFRIKNVSVQLEKDTLYYPDNLTLTVKNKGFDIDLDQPLLVFDNFWLKRKFKIKGMDNHLFYPLYLEKGKTHTLTIDLNRFYSHDKKLKKFPKAKIIVYDVKGKKVGSSSVFLRKTLVKF